MRCQRCKFVLFKKISKMDNGAVETKSVSAKVVSTKGKKKERRFVATVAVYGKAKELSSSHSNMVGA